ncbi:MAG TPA: hypothetical protein VF316_17170 [Polyangiaceae bacterium]
MALRASLFGTVALAAALAVGCSAPSGDTDSSSDDLTGVTSTERPITFTSFVYVDPSASNGDIQTAIARQVKTALGALREPKVSLDDRAAQSNVDPNKWTLTTLDVVDPANPGAPAKKVLKVTFPYADRAVVTNALASRSAVDFTMLAGDYAGYADTLKKSCSDDVTTDTDSLWYHFQPTIPACKTLVAAELSRIQTEQGKLAGHPGAIGPAEAGRWFMPVTAKLGPAKVPATAFAPEYDRLFGVGTDKSTVVVYAFFGVDTDETDPDDLLAQEAMKFLRTMLAAQPNFRPTKTEPSVMLLDLFVDGKQLSNVTYERMFQWLVDKSGYPAEVGNDATKISALRRQALAKFTERTITWDLPMFVKDSKGSGKNVTVEVRSFYGYEDGSADARQHAQWRYLEAFWYGDVFLYNGHSHFGHGPLEPTLYGAQNFNDRYQIMLVNSCISFNYYHDDFLRMKPGGSRNLDMVVNGLPSYVLDGGVATGRFFTGLVSGKQPSYTDLLNGMRLDYPWGEKQYDPMRVVDGELDNVFSQAKTPLSLVALAPVY